MARMQSMSRTRQRLDEKDPKWPLKVVLRVAATFFALVGAVLFILVISKTLHLDSPYFESADGDMTDEIPLAPLFLSLIYNPLSIFLFVCVRQGWRVHPGWHVVVDLIIWTLCVSSITIALWGGWFVFWQPFYSNHDNAGGLPCAKINFFSEKCSPEIYVMGRKEIAGCVCLFFILGLHFVLFVMACIDVWKLRKSTKSFKKEKRNNGLQYNRCPEEFLLAQPPPSYSASNRAARVKDVEQGKEYSCPDCNLPGLGCCER